MEIETLKTKDKNTSSFILKKSTPGFANALRRTMINEVPAMAIDTVEISKNSGILYDEMVAQRLGLVVLKTDLKSYNLPDKCSCNGEGCAQCQLKLTLKAKGPGYVHASDIKSQDPKVKPVHENAIITKLTKGQEIELEATAILGKGKEHAKFSPGLVFYKHPANIKIKNPNKDVEDTVKSCPLNILEEKKGKITVNTDKLKTCHLCLSCQEESKNNVTVTEEKENFIFTIERWGQLDAKTITKRAAEIIEDKCDDFSAKLSEI